MTAITDISKPIGQGLAAFAGNVIRRVQQFARAAKHRHDAAKLAGLDERMLADIGLTRNDLLDAFSQPLWRDPTTVLESRAGERHAYWRQSGPAALRVIAAPPIGSGSERRGRDTWRGQPRPLIRTF